MAASTPSTILLKGEPTRYERDAGGVITPGNMLQLESDNTVVVHATAVGESAKWFATENDIAGDDLNHDYASGEVTQIHAAKPGDEMFVYVDGTVDVAVGNFLESFGSGVLGILTAGIPIAMALEAQAVDSPIRIKVVIV